MKFGLLRNFKIAFYLLGFGSSIPVGSEEIQHDGWVAAVAYSPDGKLATGGEDSITRIWSTCLELVEAVKSHDSAITTLAFSPDGKQLATGYWDGTLVVKYMDGKRLDFAARDHLENITCIEYSHDGKLLATGSGDDSLHIRSTRDFKILTTIELGNEYDVNCLSFTPDATRIATGDGENELKVWDAQNGDELLFIDGHDETVTSVAFSPDGKSLYSGSWDDSVVKWEVEDGTPLKVFETEAKPGEDLDVMAFALSKTGRRLAVLHDPSTLRVWDTHGAKLLLNQKFPHNLTSLSFSHDGKMLAVASKGIVRIHLSDGL